MTLISHLNNLLTNIFDDYFNVYVIYENFFCISYYQPNIYTCNNLILNKFENILKENKFNYKIKNLGIDKKLFIMQLKDIEYLIGLLRMYKGKANEYK